MVLPSHPQLHSTSKALSKPPAAPSKTALSVPFTAPFVIKYTKRLQECLLFASIQESFWSHSRCPNPKPPSSFSKKKKKFFLGKTWVRRVIELYSLAGLSTLGGFILPRSMKKSRRSSKMANRYFHSLGRVLVPEFGFQS